MTFRRFALNVMAVAVALPALACGGSSGPTSQPTASSPPVEVASGQDALAVARDAYVAFAADANAKVAPIKQQLEAAMTVNDVETAKDLIKRFVTAIADGDEKLQRMSFPSELRPLVEAVVNDDRTIRDGLLRAANGHSCAEICAAYRQTAPAFDQRTQDIGKLREALGLEPT